MGSYGVRYFLLFDAQPRLFLGALKVCGPVSRSSRCFSVESDREHDVLRVYRNRASGLLDRCPHRFQSAKHFQSNRGPGVDRTFVAPRYQLLHRFRDSVQRVWSNHERIPTQIPERHHRNYHECRRSGGKYRGSADGLWATRAGYRHDGCPNIELRRISTECLSRVSRASGKHEACPAVSVEGADGFQCLYAPD
jgi:hypothetical protein